MTDNLLIVIFIIVIVSSIHCLNILLRRQPITFIQINNNTEEYSQSKFSSKKPIKLKKNKINVQKNINIIDDNGHDWSKEGIWF